MPSEDAPADPAPDPGDLRHGAQLGGERGDHRHRVGAGGQRVAKQHEGLTVPAGDGGVGDLERVGLHPAGVVVLDDGFGDLPRAIGDELLAGGRELGEVVAERGDQRPQGPGLMLRPARELRHREVELVAVFLQIGADDLDPPPMPERIASSSFFPRTPPPCRSASTVSSAVCRGSRASRR